MNYIQSILLGMIEGITEFFPISSTGHMILVASLMGILNHKITSLFLISVQFGSILSIIFLYRKKLFFQKLNFYIKILISILPVGLVGLFFQKKINILFNNPLIVSLSLIIGGLIILKTENFYEKKTKFFSENQKNPITYYQALIIGLFQCFSLIPGVSRSGTTIISGMLQKNISRKNSIEFSFFLSIPVIGLATFKKIYDYYDQIKNDNPDLSHFFFETFKLLLLGNIISFITSMISIKCFMKYLKNHNLKFFGYYRIIFGIFSLFFN